MMSTNNEKPTTNDRKLLHIVPATGGTTTKPDDDDNPITEHYPLSREDGFVITDKGIYTISMYAKVAAFRVPILAARPEVLGITTYKSIPETLTVPANVKRSRLVGQNIDVRFTSNAGDIEVNIDTQAKLKRTKSKDDIEWTSLLVGYNVCAAPKTIELEPIYKCIEGITVRYKDIVPHHEISAGVGLHYLDGQYVMMNPIGSPITHDHSILPYASALTELPDHHFSTLPYGWYPYRHETIADDVRSLLRYRAIVPNKTGIGTALLASALHAPFSQLAYTPGIIIEGLTGNMKTAVCSALMATCTEYTGDRDEKVTWLGRTRAGNKIGTTEYKMMNDAQYLRGVLTLHDDCITMRSEERLVQEAQGMLSNITGMLIGRKAKGRGTSNNGESATAFGTFLTSGYITTVESLHMESSADPSTIWRLILLHLDRPGVGDSVVDSDLLKWIQQEDTAHAMNNVLHGFIAWMLTPDRLAGVIHGTRALEARYTCAGNHNTPIQNAAKCEYIWAQFLSYAYEIDALTALEADDLLQQVRRDVQDTINTQVMLMGTGNAGTAQSDDPSSLYLQALRDAMRDGKLHLSNVKRGLIDVSGNEGYIQLLPPLPSGVSEGSIGWKYNHITSSYGPSGHEAGALLKDGRWIMRVSASTHQHIIYPIFCEIIRKRNYSLPLYRDLLDILTKKDILLTKKTVDMWSQKVKTHVIDLTQFFDDGDQVDDEIPIDDAFTSDENEEEYN